MLSQLSYGGEKNRPRAAYSVTCIQKGRRQMLSERRPCMSSLT